jgi:hypothetical protein
LSRREKIVWLIIGTIFFVSFLSLVPAYYQICEADQYTKREYCAVHQMVPFALLKIAHFLDAIGSALTALATIAIAGFTYTLWKATVGIASDAKASTEAQSADTHILQRAYIAVEGNGISPLAVNSVAHINVKNVGNLPAKNVRWFIEAETDGDGRRADFPIDEAKFYGNNALPPGTNMLRSQNFVLTDEIIEKISKGKLVIYVWGKICYLDGFGVPRFTRFCHRYDRRGFKRTEYQPVTRGTPLFPQFRTEMTAESMRYHQYGNDAD